MSRRSGLCWIRWHSICVKCRIWILHFGIVNLQIKCGQNSGEICPGTSVCVHFQLPIGNYRRNRKQSFIDEEFIYYLRTDLGLFVGRHTFLNSQLVRFIESCWMATGWLLCLSVRRCQYEYKWEMRFICVLQCFAWQSVQCCIHRHSTQYRVHTPKSRLKKTFYCFVLFIIQELHKRPAPRVTRSSYTHTLTLSPSLRRFQTEFCNRHTDITHFIRARATKESSSSCVRCCCLIIDDRALMATHTTLFSSNFLCRRFSWASSEMNETNIISKCERKFVAATTMDRWDHKRNENDAEIQMIICCLIIEEKTKRSKTKIDEIVWWIKWRQSGQVNERISKLVSHRCLSAANTFVLELSDASQSADVIYIRSSMEHFIDAKRTPTREWRGGEVWWSTNDEKLWFNCAIVNEVLFTAIRVQSLDWLAVERVENKRPRILFLIP